MQGGPTPVRRFFGYALAAVGALIATTAGLCSGWAVLSLVLGLFRKSNDTEGNYAFASMLFIPIVGGIPLAIGVAIAVAGWRMATRR